MFHKWTVAPAALLLTSLCSFGCVTADRFIYQCLRARAAPPPGPVSNAPESPLQDYKHAFLLFFPSPPIKCCFSRLCRGSEPMCVCILGRMCGGFVPSGWKMARRRGRFATLFDHCKYEFRLFLYRELKWSLILRKLDVNSHHLRGWEGVVNGISFFLFLPQVASVFREVQGTSHVALVFVTRPFSFSFLHDSAEGFSVC